MLLEKKDFDVLTATIKKHSGIVIGSDKEYLLESRLVPIARNHGLSNLAELVAHMQKGSDSGLIVEIVEGMTTNESFFFRDFKPFDYLRDKLMPELIATRPTQNKFRIWSSASSSGQEAYSAAITLLESAAFAGKTFEILATDIDSSVLKRGIDGLYSQFEVQRGMPISFLLKYFQQEGEQWRVKDNLKKYMKFEQFNLLDKPNFGVFDVVFCRNVLIYFDVETKQQVLKNLATSMQPHSFLLTGGAESLIGLNSPFVGVEGLINTFRMK
jgi:chemotaxis protein methyltransferase CheR